MRERTFFVFEPKGCECGMSAVTFYPKDPNSFGPLVEEGTLGVELVRVQAWLVACLGSNKLFFHALKWAALTKFGSQECGMFRSR